MSSACRAVLANLQPRPDTHAGLLQDRFLSAHEKKVATAQPTQKALLLESITALSAPEPYSLAYARWKETAAARGCLVVEAETVGSLAVGLGNASPLEVGLTVHHTYGMPVIPGSAVKGLLRRVALESGLPKDAPEFQSLFGGRDAASCFTFWDAWYDPASVEGRPFHRDVITVHHPNYYGSRGGKGWPTDFDDPTPVPFLVVRPGARFFFAVETSSPEWSGYTRKLLEWGLANLGLGAKTNAGYGRFATAGQGAIAAPTAAELRAAVVTESWPGAHVSYNAGPQELTAANADGKRSARVRGAAARAILESLPEDVKSALKKKGRLMTVECEATGNAFTIVAVSERGS